MSELLARQLNAVALLAIVGVLGAALADQFLLAELPCPLCLLQRAGFALAGAGLALNLLAGVRPAHYGLAILGALLGGAVALCQIALHVIPGAGGHADPVLGLHPYTWAFLVFATIIAGVATLLLSNLQFTPDFDLEGERPHGRFLPRLAVVLFALVVIANGAAALAECGTGVCPEDPAGYQGIDVLRELLSGRL